MAFRPATTNSSPFFAGRRRASSPKHTSIDEWRKRYPGARWDNPITYGNTNDPITGVSVVNAAVDGNPQNAGRPIITYGKPRKKVYGPRSASTSSPGATRPRGPYSPFFHGGGGDSPMGGYVGKLAPTHRPPPKPTSQEGYGGPIVSKTPRYLYNKPRRPVRGPSVRYT